MITKITNYQPDADFLSRLCGGEVGVRALETEQKFLSRLCGGEARWGA